jgi:hypothetical protein
MTVKDLMEALRVMDPDYAVHTDEDDYPHVTAVRSGSEYDGPVEYTPPENCVLLTIDFPKQ